MLTSSIYQELDLSSYDNDIDFDRSGTAELFPVLLGGLRLQDSISAFTKPYPDSDLGHPSNHQRS